MDAPPARHRLSAGSRVKHAGLRAARALYYRTATSPAASLLNLPFVQRLKGRLKASVSGPDVIEILAALESGHVQAWVAGGWGVDALLGEQTRGHEDLDLVFDATDERGARAALEELGFRRIEEEHELVPHALMPNRIVMRDGPGRTVDLHGVDLRTWPRGWLERLAHEGRAPAAPVDPEDRFARGSLDGRPVPCLSATLQLASRQVYEPTDSDRRDAALLCERYGLPLPRLLEARPVD
jgi:lincosamide nucleotidyltransferase A/C/D/E